jgi:hypothetical protein
MASSSSYEVENRQTTVIEGLRLTLTGEEVRTLLDERIRAHERRIARWKHELTRTPEDQTEDAPLLPEHICENEAEAEEWRRDRVAFIRDHVERGEVYRLGEADLAFGELLPEKPGSMEQDEYEERTAPRFDMRELTQSIRALGSSACELASQAHAASSRA